MVDEYEDIIDEAEDQYEDSQDLQDLQTEQFETTYPVAKEKSDIFTWFWRVVRQEEPFKLVKTANLNKLEIGEHGISVRDAMNLAYLGDIFHHKKFGEYFGNRTKIIAATSMAKKGWLMETSISQKRVRERSKSPTASQEEGWRMKKKRKYQQEG